MKKNVVLIIIILFILFSNISCARVEKNKDVNSADLINDIINVCIPVGRTEHEKTLTGDEIEIDNYGRLLIPGEPNLNSKIFSIAIPPNAVFVDLQYIIGKGIVLPGRYDINPVPYPKFSNVVKNEAKINDEQQFNKKTYNSDKDYPTSIVEFQRVSGFRKYNLVDLRINPISYKPLSGMITYYPDITVHISYELKEDNNPANIMFDDVKCFEKRASEFILNYNESQKWYSKGQTGREQYNFVIITLENLTSYIGDLVAWEEAKGKSVYIATTEWINSNYNGYDLAEKMRNFLREKYPSEEWGIQDLLIIGHRDDIPMRQTWQDLGGGKPETDYYYAELSLPDNESWDADGDHQYGENSDPIDFYGEINVGRIPWSDPSTVAHICEKSANYEQNNDPSFKNNILLLGAFIDSNTDGAVFMEYLVDSTIHPWMAYWMKTRLYETDSNYKMDFVLNHQNVVDVWSSGKFAFVSWHSHGSPFGTSFINVNDCQYLNDDYPAIISAASCSNSDTDYLNIGQAMMKQGAVGFLGANKIAYYRPGWDDPNDGSDQSFKYFFKSCVTSKNYTQGQAHQYAISEMYKNGLWNNLKYETFVHSSLWGNPDLGFKSIYENDPPEKPTKPNGPVDGKVGAKYTYSTFTTDINMENIYYFFDWGDGSNSGWFGPYLPNETVEASHSWSELDNYEIKVIAQDINGTKSSWSDPLSISITRSKNKDTAQFIESLKELLDNHPHIFSIIRLLLKQLSQ